MEGCQESAAPDLLQGVRDQESGIGGPFRLPIPPHSSDAQISHSGLSVTASATISSAPAIELPRIVTLLHAPSRTDIDASIVELTDAMIERQMGDAWWNHPAIDPVLAESEIDRYWDWTQLRIEHADRILRSRRLAIVTADDAVQGAMMVSVDPVECERRRERGRPALFVELLFAAPQSRPWVRTDRTEHFRGVGLYLLRAAAELSLEAGFAGRLKLEASPGSVGWYRKRGLLEVSRRRIVYEGVKYTLMELEADRVAPLLTP